MLSCGSLRSDAVTAPFSDYIVYVDESGDHSLESINSEGMQIADLTARPIGLSVLRPDQKSRAMAVLEEKFCRGEAGRKDGVGLKVFP